VEAVVLGKTYPIYALAQREKNGAVNQFLGMPIGDAPSVWKTCVMLFSSLDAARAFYSEHRVFIVDFGNIVPLDDKNTLLSMLDYCRQGGVEFVALNPPLDPAIGLRPILLSDAISAVMDAQ
jgi:hypothetical protein